MFRINFFIIFTLQICEVLPHLSDIENSFLTISDYIALKYNIDEIFRHFQKKLDFETVTSESSMDYQKIEALPGN